MNSFAKHTAVILILSTLPTAASAREPEGDFTASTILNRVIDTYGNLVSYQDRGKVTTYILGEKISQSEKPFTTAFIRPGKFRFEYQELSSGFTNKLGAAYIIWKDGESLARYFHTQPEDRYLESLDLGIAGATGVSGGSAHAVPPLLLPNLISGHKPTDIPNPIREIDESFDGYDCFIVSGGTATSSSKLWVSKHDFLIRKIERYFNQLLGLQLISVYDPVINVSIDREFLELNAPEL